MGGVRSNRQLHAAGQGRREGSSSRDAIDEVSTTLAPGCRNTMIITAGVPLTSPIARRSSTNPRLGRHPTAGRRFSGLVGHDQRLVLLGLLDLGRWSWSPTSGRWWRAVPWAGSRWCRPASRGHPRGRSHTGSAPWDSPPRGRRGRRCSPDEHLAHPLDLREPLLEDGGCHVIHPPSADRVGGEGQDKDGRVGRIDLAVNRIARQIRWEVPAGRIDRLSAPPRLRPSRRSTFRRSRSRPRFRGRARRPWPPPSPRPLERAVRPHRGRRPR